VEPPETILTPIMSKLRGTQAASALDDWLASWRERIDAILPSLLPLPRDMATNVAWAPSVHDAMAYAALAPGKRIRPTLMLAIGEMYGVRTARFLPAACAVEMVHTASLILDDLPCMDDAPTRRGRPACHVVFGEANAILASVGLLNHAYGILAGEIPCDGPDREAIPDITRDRLRCLIARRLASAIGPDGVIGGQATDLAETKRGKGAAAAAIDLQTMEFIHSHKTGSLFIASAEMGGILSGGTPPEVEALSAYAKNLGLAFQITDDLIDVEGSAQRAGKPVRADTGKATFVTLCGIEGARALAAELCESAIGALAPFGRQGGRLRDLARFVAVRDR